jgi:hypothetical protein
MTKQVNRVISSADRGQYRKAAGTAEQGLMPDSTLRALHYGDGIRTLLRFSQRWPKPSK